MEEAAVYFKALARHLPDGAEICYKERL